MKINTTLLGQPDCHTPSSLLIGQFKKRQISTYVLFTICVFHNHFIKPYPYSVLYHVNRYPKLSCLFNKHRYLFPNSLRWYREPASKTQYTAVLQYEALHMGQKNPIPTYMLGTDGIGSSFAEKEPGSLWVTS